MTGQVADALLPSVGFLPTELPGFFRLSDPGRDGEERTRSAVRALRTMGHRVATESPFDVPGTALRPGEPDVAFGRHTDLGIAAAVTDGLPIDPGAFLTRPGWRYRPDLDVYLSPAQLDEGLDAVATADKQLQRGRYTTTVHPDLAPAVRRRGTDTRERLRAEVVLGAHGRLASPAVRCPHACRALCPAS